MQNILYLKENIIPKKCFLWISINKPFDNIFWEKQIRYLENNFDQIIVLIADEIDIINQINIENKNILEAKKNVKNKYILWENYIRNKTKLIAKEKKDSKIWYDWVVSKFIYCSWNEISNNKRFNQVYLFLKNKYEESNWFRTEIRKILDNYLTVRWKKEIITNLLLDNLSDYIISELVTLVDWIDYKWDNYNCIVYPTFKETIWWMNNLAKQIYNEIWENINLRWKVLIESSF